VPDFTTLADGSGAATAAAGASGAVHVSRGPSYVPITSCEKIADSAAAAGGLVLKLDWNEGTIQPPPSVRAALRHLIEEADGGLLKWYPHLAGGDVLRARIASYCGAIPENVLVTNGACIR
jgi:histidinol-phosphate/aromatic aminotransferase/cobyric acid decarboxylase-like protein